MPSRFNHPPSSRPPTRRLPPAAPLAAAVLAITLASAGCRTAAPPAPPAQAPRAGVAELERQLEVGDMVFIRITALPFRKVAEATGSWTNHVGIVTAVAAGRATVSESRFPLSAETSLAHFVARSEGGRVAVTRLNDEPTEPQRAAIRRAARARLGVFYDTGFNLASRRQFCSRYVREVLGEARGVEVGQVESFETLLRRNPEIGLGFWRVWYFGRIPWARETVTPASLLRGERAHPVFDGIVVGANANGRAPASMGE